MRTFIIVCLAVLAIITVFRVSEARSSKLMEIGECVERMMTEDNYQGDYRLGWEMYAESCQ